MRRSWVWFLVLVGIASLAVLIVNMTRKQGQDELKRRDRTMSTGTYSRSTLTESDKVKVRAGWTYDTKARRWVDENLQPLPDGAKP